MKMKKDKKAAQDMHGSHAVEEEEDFPRGGGSGLAPVELKRIREVCDSCISIKPHERHRDECCP